MAVPSGHGEVPPAAERLITVSPVDSEKALSR
jgi:hypothetical protein